LIKTLPERVLIANQNKPVFTFENILMVKYKVMKEVREKINSIDDKMLKHLAERRKLSVEILKLKMKINQRVNMS
jgi:hypothetical protein